MNAPRVGGLPLGCPSCVQPRRAFIMLVYIVGCSRIQLFQKPNHNECPACGRGALGPSKLRAAAQGIHYASLTCMMRTGIHYANVQTRMCMKCQKMSHEPARDKSWMWNVETLDTKTQKHK
jgi:hypothetical protein